MSQTILVAEDSATMRQVVEMAFKGLPFRVVSVEAGEQALQAAYEHRPSVVILDYHLPDRSGMDVCRALRSDPTLGGTPVLMLGGNYHPFSEDQALQSGCNAVLMKPFKTDELTGKVAELARNAPQPSAASRAPTPSSSNRPRFGESPSSPGVQGTGRYPRQPSPGRDGGGYSQTNSGSASALRRTGFTPAPRSSNPFN
ncbi:MAG: response regulator [Myxococcota bacterium]